MNQSLLKTLREWRSAQAAKEQIECYMILHNKTLETIAEAMPKSQKDLLAIKGIGERTFQKYGQNLLNIVREYNGGGESSTAGESTEENLPATLPRKVYTVSTYLTLINSNLSSLKATIQGEVNGLNPKERVLYFNLKDKEDGSVIGCMIWKNEYQLSGLKLEEGLEIIAQGMPEVYKPQGRFSFKVSFLELVGEGALKKAYLELKTRLEKEGCFDPEKKRPIPDFPQNIGLITSRNGEAIFDFRKNLGHFGFKITFYDSRVEGQTAIRDLLSALRYFKDKQIDALVITRGGGSFESLNVFNHELLVREISSLPFPVICGIGHERDVPLMSLAADLSVSTPTAAARVLNESWETLIHKTAIEESRLFANYERALRHQKDFLNRSWFRITEFQSTMSLGFRKLGQDLEKCLWRLAHEIRNKKSEMLDCAGRLVSKMQICLSARQATLLHAERTIRDNNPEKQLRMGYTITRFEGRILRSISEVQPGNQIQVILSDGKITSEIKNITNH